MKLKDFNQQFSLPEELHFSEKHRDFPIIEVNNRYAIASISVYGGHVLSFQTHDSSRDLIFMSDATVYKQGKAIRGGIPICWPWFGNYVAENNPLVNDSDNLKRPAHGFARTRLWNVKSTRSMEEGTAIVLSLNDTSETRLLWPYAFMLELEILIGKTLRLSLRSINTGNQPFSITQALHSYLAVDIIENAVINGLDGLHYFDKLTRKQTLQSGDVVIDQMVDRIYHQAPETIHLTNQQQNTTITSQGHDSCVVWNPWIDGATKMSDLPDDAYQQFVCIETATTEPRDLVLQPGDQHTLMAEYKSSD